MGSQESIREQVEKCRLARPGIPTSVDRRDHPRTRPPSPPIELVLGAENWKRRDLAVREDGRLSFDVKLARNPKNFDLRRNGWKSDHCFVCEWTLFESEEQPDRGIGYTNGRDWVWADCYEKFLSGPDYFRSAHSEMT